MPIKASYILAFLLLLTFACKNRDVVKENQGNHHNNKLPYEIHIQPYDEIDSATISFIQQELGKVYDFSTITLPPKKLPADAWYAERHRYWADTLLKHLKKLSPSSNIYAIGITGKDISTKKSKYPNWGVMGLGLMPGNACVISDYRLQAYPKTREHIDSQLLKVAIHELGHNFGLPHCPNETCYMTDAEGKNKLDGETGFCKECRKFLRDKQAVK